jgi:ketosteroid isomerase-like protein
MIQHHLLKILTGGLTATAGINGAPLLIDPTGIGLNGSMPANPWLKPGENTLSIFLSPPLTTSGVVPPEIQFHAQVYSIKINSLMNEPDQFLARFDREARDPVPLPVAREIPFVVKEAPPTKLWAEATVIKELSTADKQQLRALVQKFAEAIQSRDLDAISAVLDYKTKDCALANGQDPAHMHEMIRKLYKEGMLSEPSFRIEGAQGNVLSFKLIAGGQAVWLFQSLSAPALVVRSQAARYTLMVFAAKIGGAWRIVR